MARHSMKFEFLKKYNFTRYTCTCGISYWRSNLYTDSGCGQCSKDMCYNYEKLYTAIHIDEHKLCNAFLNFFNTLGYIKLKNHTQRISRLPINYMLAGICRYNPLYTQGIVYNNNVKLNGDVYNYNKFVSAQTCIRFNDFENVGVTHRHFTNFVMLGQHIFETPFDKFKTNWVQDALDELIHFVTTYVDLSLCTFHESSWSDNQNEGKSLEIFINGLEIFNQVYTTYDCIKKIPLEQKYLDMGGGLKRFYHIVNKYKLNSSLHDVIKDHVETTYILYCSGIYAAKRGTGHAIKKLIHRIKSYDIFNDICATYDAQFRNYIYGI